MSFAICPIVLALVGATTTAGTGPIVLDGSFDDWKGVPKATEDPLDDAPGAEIELGMVKIADDASSVDLMIDLGREVTIQRLEGLLAILFDADGDPATGRPLHGMEGVDLVVELSPTDPGRPTRAGQGAGVRIGKAVGGGDKPESPYRVGLAIAPTHASRLIEMRLDRDVMTGEAFSVKVLYLMGGRIVDQTLVAEHQLTEVAPSPIEQERDPLARAHANALRVISWNAEFGALFKNPEPFIRTLAALDPEVILFQELTNKNTAAQLQSLLDRRVGGRSDTTWSVIFGSGGGGLRCAIASRYPLENVTALDGIPLPGRANRTIRTAGALMEHDGRRLLIVSVHLKCCGRSGSSEDITRRVEIVEIRNAVTAAAAGSDFDGLIIGGDMNLVGSGRLIDVLVDGLDVDGSALAIANPLQIDGRSNATWFDPGAPFLPGRLDYMVYSDASINALDGFVFESVDLAPRWLREHGLEQDDSRNSTDHMPIVLDLEWQPR